MNLIGVTGRAGSGKDTAADFLVKNSGYVKVAFADEMKRICARVYPFMTREHLWGPSAKRNEPIKAYPRSHGPWVGKPNSDNKFELRCACCSVLQADVDILRGSGLVEPCFLTARYALQQLGSEWGRDCYENTWVDFTLNVATLLLRSDSGLHYTPWDGLFEATIHPHFRIKGVVISDVRWPGGNEGQAIVDVGGKLMKMLRGEGLAGGPGQHQSEKAMDVPDRIFHFLIDNRKYELRQLEQHMLELSMLHP